MKLYRFLLKECLIHIKIANNVIININNLSIIACLIRDKIIIINIHLVINFTLSLMNKFSLNNNITLLKIKKLFTLNKMKFNKIIILRIKIFKMIIQYLICLLHNKNFQEINLMINKNNN